MSGIIHYKIEYLRELPDGIRERASRYITLHASQNCELQAALNKPTTDMFGNPANGWKVSEIEPIGVE